MYITYLSGIVCTFNGYYYVIVERALARPNFVFPELCRYHYSERVHVTPASECFLRVLLYNNCDERRDNVCTYVL